MFNLSKSTTTDTAFENFIINCKVKNLSQETIRSYQTQIKPFLNNYANTEISSINKSIVNEYFLTLKQKNITERSVKSYACTLRIFLYYCMEEGYIPKFSISLPKASKTPKETYTIEELQKLLKKPKIAKSNFSEYRMWVLSNYLLATGNRISTALNIKISDVDLVEGQILLKKNKDRRIHVVPLTQKITQILKEYLYYRGEGEYLFCNNSNSKWYLRACQIYQRSYNKKRGVSKTGFHRFRHTFAKMWIMNGGDIFRLQKMLGHKDISTVKEYIEIFDVDLKQNIEETNPLNLISPPKIKLRLRN